MELTKKQEEGLKIAVSRFLNNEKFTVIGGYAGSGKSTLVRFIIEALSAHGIDEEDVCYATFTGKAAQVLIKKGNTNSLTLHKLLYNSKPLPNGRFFHEPVKDIPYKIVVVDEVSMAPKNMMNLLFSYGVHVICLGDPFQLPPIDKNQNNHLLDSPHIFLDEIMRQAQESEIIRMTMGIREGKSIPHYQGKDVMVLDKKELTPDMLLWADQVLCATNVTRVDLNNKMRKSLGFYGEPKNGDKVICTRNYWEIMDDDLNPLVNGTIGYLKNTFNNFIVLPKFICGRVNTICGEMTSDSDTLFQNLSFDKKLLIENKKSLDSRQQYKMMRSTYKDLIPLEFAYGYAITTHKAQGSQFDKVLVIEESFPFDKVEHARWLYTAATRSTEKLVLVR